MSGQQPSAQTRTPAATSGTALTAWRWVLQWRHFQSLSTVVSFKEVAVIPGEGVGDRNSKLLKRAPELCLHCSCQASQIQLFGDFSCFLLLLLLLLWSPLLFHSVCVGGWVCARACAHVQACAHYTVYFYVSEGIFYFIWMKGGGNKIKLHVYSQILIFKKRAKSKDKKQSSCTFSVCWQSALTQSQCQHFTLEWYICCDQWTHTHCNHTNFIVYTKLHSVQWVSEERTRNKRNKCQLNKERLLSRLFLLS